jgi:hypothetical protein
VNKEIKAKWLAALRSGEFAQTKKVLRDMDGYCCLGVLCCVMYQNEDWSDYDSFRGNYTIPPDGLLAEAELRLIDAEYLSVMNDEGASFETIAKKIELDL